MSLGGIVADVIAAALEGAGTQAVAAGADALRDAASRLQNPSGALARAGLGDRTEYETVEELAEEFHGRPVIEMELDTPTAPLVPDELAGLGLLHSLTFVCLIGEGGNPADDEFEDINLEFDTEENPVVVAADPSNHQLYLVGGQEQQAKYAEPFADESGRYVPFGNLTKIEYLSDKHHLEGQRPGEEVQYWHRFGEETGEVPTLVYDRDSQTFLIQGGRYTVEPGGITN